MFFKRKSKKLDTAAERVANPRVVDVRMTTIEPLHDDIRQTMDIGSDEEDIRKIPEYETEERGDGAELEEGGASVFRPRFRPPMAVLRVFDDNQKSYEMFRMRGDRMIIGRDDGDVIISHDKLMSGRHAELVRRFEDGKYVWHLYDLQSRNGSFVKIDFIRLKDGDELILGAATYTFEESRQSSPRLIEMASRRPRQVKFKQKEFWIGRDLELCVPALADDHLLDEKHVRVQFAKERWCVMASSSRNGVWARIDKVQLSNGTKFQLGEQRFQILMP